MKRKSSILTIISFVVKIPRTTEKDKHCSLVFALWRSDIIMDSALEMNITKIINGFGNIRLKPSSEYCRMLVVQALGEMQYCKSLNNTRAAQPILKPGWEKTIISSNGL